MKNKGFTLIEILVVVLIIGILAAIAIPKYQMSVAKTHLNTLKDMTRSIKNASDLYFFSNGNYPTQLSDLDISVPNNGSLKGGRCYIGSSAIFCNKRKLLGVPIEYGISKKRDSRTCVVYSQNLNDAPNRLCQQDTGKKAEQATCVSNYCSYSY